MKDNNKYEFLTGVVLIATTICTLGSFTIAEALTLNQAQQMNVVETCMTTASSTTTNATSTTETSVSTRIANVTSTYGTSTTSMRTTESTTTTYTTSTTSTTYTTSTTATAEAIITTTQTEDEEVEVITEPEVVYLDDDPVIDEVTYNNLTISDADYILLCNCVAHEAGSNSISATEKAKVVEVVMNRVYSASYPDTIYEVITQRGQFSGSSSYANLGTYSSKVTDLVKEGVDLYFTDPSQFNHGYLSFSGDGRRNYFR